MNEALKQVQTYNKQKQKQKQDGEIHQRHVRRWKWKCNVLWRTTTTTKVQVQQAVFATVDAADGQDKRAEQGCGKKVILKKRRKWGVVRKEKETIPYL